MLNTETDVLEESNKEIRDQIQKILDRGELSDKEKERLQTSLEKELDHLEQEVERK